jgi:hypothetical protein
MPGAGVDAAVASSVAGTVPAAPDVTAGVAVAGVAEEDVHPEEKISRTASTAIIRRGKTRLIYVIIY